MQRTQIALEDEDRALLNARAAETGLSISALIGEAVRHYFGQANSVDDDLAVIAASAGAWTDRDFDGEQYVDGLRSGRRIEMILGREE